MKPVGPIPPGFAAIDGELAIGGMTASQLIAQAGASPLFVYSRTMLEARIAQLRAALPPRVNINYAIKANPLRQIVEFMSDLVDGFDIASGGELALAQAAGLDLARLSFAGPGKRDVELAAAIAAGVTLNVESASELRRALKLGDAAGLAPRLALRVNPDFELRGSGMKMGGGAKPFGIDQSEIPAVAAELLAAGAEFRGLHIFTGSQSLDTQAIIETQSNVLALADRLAGDIGQALPKLNMGGGFGIPYFHGDTPIDLAAIGQALAEQLGHLPDTLADTELCIELGRYLVGEAGVYLTTVLDRKESHGDTYLVTDGGLHHQLAASGNFGTVVRRNYPVAIATRFTAEPQETASVVGCLCTPLDRLADKAHLPRADVGDIVAVFCAGAYGATASPAAFLGQGPAREILL
ncbi:pyridoxal-dependent decarboxylase, exosortase A system-associated [Altererythrobacter confluentis]|uniref:Pyridoxal-dependent decarboxylase, exosortase A system-associated n=1 Tax=Allopontixanthobacter confluentis TaxID=1849021 RepID=A0A6L7GF50_9SPHN|nr:pyridoxal-dependent decarboxylase, exosortase A system-associated [Allopontixanthobacter confluentis]MXP14260.1 pyridoxal-dependent decarboxylase, exosortase A system-associated [Allopontixanthobacter confluentis]